MMGPTVYFPLPNMSSDAVGNEEATPIKKAYSGVLYARHPSMAETLPKPWALFTPGTLGSNQRWNGVSTRSK